MHEELLARITDPDMQEKSANAALTAWAGGAGNATVDKDVIQVSVIGPNVENVHKINVVARFAPDDGMHRYAPPAETPAAAPESASGERVHRLKVRQFSFLGGNYSTHDFIDVDLEVGGRILSFASLDLAIEKVFGFGRTAPQ